MDSLRRITIVKDALAFTTAVERVVFVVEKQGYMLIKLSRIEKAR